MKPRIFRKLCPTFLILACAVGAWAQSIEPRPTPNKVKKAAPKPTSAPRKAPAKAPAPITDAPSGGGVNSNAGPRPVPAPKPVPAAVKPPTDNDGSRSITGTGTPGVKPPTASETPVPLSVTPSVKPPTSAESPTPLTNTPGVKPPTNSKDTAKANARPAATPAPEPFDKATAEQMAGQCVTLTTELGDIEFEVYPEHAPETVRNFLNLTASGSLDMTTFSRVVKGFVVQGGNLATGPEWNLKTAARMSRTIPDEPNQIKHERGVVSMARGDQPNSASTNFFILVGTGQHLDGTFAAFGRVRKGMEIADKINEAPALEEKPEKPVRINKARVAPCAATP